MSSVQKLRDVIRRVHGVDSEHVYSLPIKEEVGGQTVWEGVVEVFNLEDHSTASRVYAWMHQTDELGQPRHVTVLHLHPIKSARDAVKAAIAQEFKNLGTAEGW